jgi:hypothetical protein
MSPREQPAKGSTLSPIVKRKNEARKGILCRQVAIHVIFDRRKRCRLGRLCGFTPGPSRGYVHPTRPNTVAVFGPTTTTPTRHLNLSQNKQRKRWFRRMIFPRCRAFLLVGYIHFACLSLSKHHSDAVLAMSAEEGSTRATSCGLCCRVDGTARTEVVRSYTALPHGKTVRRVRRNGGAGTGTGSLAATLNFRVKLKFL